MYIDSSKKGSTKTSGFSKTTKFDSSEFISIPSYAYSSPSINSSITSSSRLQSLMIFLTNNEFIFSVEIFITLLLAVPLVGFSTPIFDVAIKFSMSVILFTY